MKQTLLRVGNRKLKVEILESPNELSKGLMFRSGNVILKLDKEKRFGASIHTFFCKPLLVAWLDKNMKVVDVKKTKPFFFYLPKNPAKYVFETTNTKLNIKIGDKLKIYK
ncbi:MAG: DUF192 domain-containing protein [Nanoarchaeota archaeon]|nr:DUF192 domain-containing protein [Nanoarchaeota archaeon]